MIRKKAEILSNEDKRLPLVVAIFSKAMAASVFEAVKEMTLNDSELKVFSVKLNMQSFTAAIFTSVSPKQMHKPYRIDPKNLHAAILREQPITVTPANASLLKKLHTNFAHQCAGWVKDKQLGPARQK
jgi:hypothetical protein